MQNSIRRDLSIRISIMIFSISIGIGIVSYFFSVQYHNKEFKQTIETQTKYFTDIFTLQLWVFDLNTTRELCKLISESTQVSGLRLFNHNRELIFEQTPLDNKMTVLVNKELRYKGKKTVGYLEVFFVDSSWEVQEKNILFIVISIIIGTIAGMFFVINTLLNRYLSRPLEELQKDMALLEQGKFHQSGLVKQKIEIQNIIDTFNKMAASLQERDSDVTKKTEELKVEISERKQAEKALQSSEIKHKTYVENAPLGIFVFDYKGKYIDINLEACKLLGYTYDELIKLSIPDISIPGVGTKKFEQLKKEGAVSYEGGLKRKDGSTIDVRFDAVSLLNDQFITFCTDISERKESEEEKRKLEKQLQQSQKMESIGNLAGGIAHEFNNMLAIIMGNNELIMEELAQGSLARESSEEIRIAGLRARDVVKQLLTFSRHDDAVKKVMDFTSVVQESMKLIRSSTPANIKIEQNLSADTYPIMGNSTQINQIFINLCNNAVDALPEKGGILTIELLNETIDIKHQTKLNPGQYVKLIVSDNGIGMDDGILDRIFEPYFTTKDIGEGTGIGMAVVHGIVERHGGEIIVNSKPGQGTTFTTFLPAHEGLLERETDEVDILPVGDEYILYVDDEPSIARLGKRLLDSLGYTTESITDPETALDMLRSNPNKFDLLITDMAMPNMTGDQLVTETLKIRRDMPTIICTGYSAKISEEEATEIGVRSYIMKPINKSELAKMVRRVLDGEKNSTLVDL